MSRGEGERGGSSGREAEEEEREGVMRKDSVRKQGALSRTSKRRGSEGGTVQESTPALPA